MFGLEDDPEVRAALEHAWESEAALYRGTLYAVPEDLGNAIPLEMVACPEKPSALADGVVTDVV